MGLPGPARAPPPQQAPEPAAPPPEASRAGTDPHTFAVAGTRRKVLPDEDPTDRHAPRRFPVSVVFRVIFAATVGFAFSWAAAWNGWIPGVFLASDLGLPATLFALLTGVSIVFTSMVPDQQLAKAVGGIPRAAGWALALHATFATATNVPQLAIGLALGTLIYQLYTSRSRLASMGLPGFGPGLPLSGAVLGAYAMWLALRRVAGPWDGFDAATATGLAALAWLVLLGARSSARRVAAWRPTAAHSPGVAARRAGERRTLVALIIGYLVFRFFISEAIPYGPIVEWFLVCIGVLFFAIIAADRIGTVPTHRSLPDPDRRTHVQRVVSLPDVRLADAESRLAVFIKSGRGTAWLFDHFTKVLADSRLDTAEAQRLLAPLSGAGGRNADPVRLTPEQRTQLVAQLIEAVHAARVRTGTLKAAPTVRADARAAAPSP